MADHLRNVAACLAASSSVPAPDLTAATLALSRTLLATSAGRSGAAPPDPTGVAVRRFIEDNVATVDVPALMAAFGFSRARLYREFGAGVSSFIRDRKLAAAMRRLSEAGGGRRPKAALLAHEVGFEDPRVFSRAFHRRYGLWPGEVSPIRDDRATLSADDAPMSWLRAL